MNVESEVKAILGSGLSRANKIDSIRRITNFQEEHIIMAMNANFEDEKDIFSKIYKELVRLDKHAKKG